MTSEQTAQCIAFLNSSWSNQPLDKVAARTWGAELQRYPFDAVIGALRDLLRTEDWRPSLAKILKSLRGDQPSATDAFSNVWSQIGKRPRRVTELEAEAVSRLGGWDRLGQWQLDRRSFYYKDFKAVWEDLIDRREKEELRAIAGTANRALTDGRTGGPGGP